MGRNYVRMDQYRQQQYDLSYKDKRIEKLLKLLKERNQEIKQLKEEKIKALEHRLKIAQQQIQDLMNTNLALEDQLSEMIRSGKTHD